MSGLRPYEAVLAIIELAASAGLLLRFLSTGLFGIYRYFFVYLIVVCTQQIGSFFIPPGTNKYALYFFATEAVIVCLYAFIVLELYSLVLHDLPGIASIARRYIRIAILIAIVLSALLLGFEQAPGKQTLPWLARFFSFERPIVSSLVCFVLLITLFLAYYPIPLNRNVIYYTIGYTFYFTAKGLALFVRNLGHQWDSFLSPALLAVSTACLIFWIYALRSSGERKRAVVGHSWSRDDEHRLLKKLDAINASLLRARK